MRESYNWGKFRLEIFVRCDVEKAFRAWATTQGIQSWFRNDVRVLRGGEALHDGRTYLAVGDEMLWADFEGQELAPSKILDVKEKISITQTFDSKTILLTNRFRAVPGGTVVELTQDKMPTDPDSRAAWHLSCFAGWTFRLANLKSVLEHGIDIRENDPELIFKPGQFIFDESWK